jgi:putative tryptophan/tyrosine transport system substrate-binding protein
MRRREFITLVGSAAAWPLAARAQQPMIPVIGFLSFAPRGPNPFGSADFRQGLVEAGYVLGQNLGAEYRWANLNHSLLPVLAAELVGHRVAVIVTTGSRYAALAAKAETSTIPIVFINDGDPVKYGLVASLNRPGGNITGVTLLTTELAGKRLNLLLELVPQAKRVGYLSGPSDSPVFEEHMSEMLAAGRALGREIILGEVRRLDFQAAFATLVEQRVGALIVGNYTLFDPPNRDKILELALHHKLPAIYPGRIYAVRGGLMSYGAKFSEQIRQAGIYTARVLKGERPANLPVLQPTKFEFVMNLKTAKMLNIAVPPILQALADEVIE